MRLNKSNFLSALLLCCSIGIGCATKDLIKPKADQIDQYIQMHPELSEYEKTCIYNGRPDIGIKDSTLVFLIGEPDAVEKVVNTKLRTKQEIWSYKSGWRFTIEDRGVANIEEFKPK